MPKFMAPSSPVCNQIIVIQRHCILNMEILNQFCRAEIAVQQLITF